MEIPTPRQLLRSLGPLAETSAQNPPRTSTQVPKSQPLLGLPLGNLLPKTRVLKQRVLERKRRPNANASVLGTQRFRTLSSRGNTIRGNRTRNSERKWHSERGSERGSERVPTDLWEVHSVTRSSMQGVCSEVPRWPLREPFRDPKTCQNLSGLLPLFLLPLIFLRSGNLDLTCFRRLREGNFVMRSILKVPLSKLCAVPLSLCLQNRALFEAETRVKRRRAKERKRGDQQGRKYDKRTRENRSVTHSDDSQALSQSSRDFLSVATPADPRNEKKVVLVLDGEHF